MTCFSFPSMRREISSISLQSSGKPSETTILLGNGLRNGIFNTPNMHILYTFPQTNILNFVKVISLISNTASFQNRWF